jgi:hypothetical protein
MFLFSSTVFHSYSCGLLGSDYRECFAAGSFVDSGSSIQLLHTHWTHNLVVGWRITRFGN